MNKEKVDVIAIIGNRAAVIRIVWLSEYWHWLVDRDIAEMET